MPGIPGHESPVAVGQITRLHYNYKWTTRYRVFSSRAERKLNAGIPVGFGKDQLAARAFDDTAAGGKPLQRNRTVVTALEAEELSSDVQIEMYLLPATASTRYFSYQTHFRASK